MGSDRAELFLSFAAADQALAEALLALLKGGPWPVFHDAPPAREAGPDWPHRERLAAARLLLLVWSAAARRSAWVGHELYFAAHARLPVLLVRADAHPLPPGLGRRSSLTALDAAGADDRTALIAAIAALLGEGATQPPPALEPGPAPQPKPESEAEPEPEPEPGPQPAPELGPKPEPEPDPKPAPGPAAGPEPDPEPPPSAHAERRALLAELSRQETPPARRLAIGRRLHDLGDPRHGVGLDGAGLPAPDWVAIPSGEVRLADGSRCTLPGFDIARWPVTHWQYQAFIEQGGYAGDDAARGRWRRVGRRWPAPAAVSAALGNAPRTMVSWYEAQAFCLWLAARRGEAIALPSEAQWVRAARGDSARLYPWGDIAVPGRAHVAQEGLRLPLPTATAPAAVGLFPGDASAPGVLDLGGNVHEWCLSAWDCPHSPQAGMHKARVLKGGSFATSQWRAMIDARPAQDPDLRAPSIGFRLVRNRA